jgi:prefoldin subunit 5
MEQKQNRHVNVALNHLQVRRDALAAKVALLNAELEKLDAAIKALE